MKYEVNIPDWKWPFYVSRHPFEGFEDLRWKKAYKMRYAIIIVALWFVIRVLESTEMPFLHRVFNERVYNVIPDFSSTVLLFLTWVVANWALCTLFNGEGTMKRVFVTSAYALVPYVGSRYLGFVISFVLSRSEESFLTFIYLFGTAWSLLLMISGIRTVHQYTIPLTILAMLFTVFGMAIIVILLVLLAMLFQQVYVFGYSVFTELLYRFPSMQPWQLGLISVGVIIAVVAIIHLLYKLHDIHLQKKENKSLELSKI